MEKKEKNNIISSGIKLSFLTLLSRILGLIREATKARFLGTSVFADAFGIAFLIPNLLRRLFAENSISVAFIPTFKEYIDGGKSKEETQEFISATFTLISFLTTVVVVLGMIFAPFIVQLFYKKGDVATISQETVILTRIMFPYLIVISIAAFFQGVLNGENIFSPSGFTPVLFNICVIAFTYILTPYMKNPARAMSLGVMIGGCVQAAFQLPFVLRAGWKARFIGLKKTFCNPGTRKVIALVVPTIIGMASYQLNDLVSTALAGRCGVGVVSSLQYSLRLQELILGIFAVSIGTVILPDLASLAKKNEWQKYNNMLLSSIKIIALITIPITFYALISGKEIISLVYKSRRFDETSVNLTLNVFRLHIIGLFFIALNRVLSPAFYAQGNTKLPTLAGIISFGVNILLSIALSFKFSGQGIAFALSVASFVNTVMLFVFLKRLKSTQVQKVVRGVILYSLKIILFSVIASVPTFFVHRFLVNHLLHLGRFIGNGLVLILSAFLFAVVGVVLLFITKDETAVSIKNKILSSTKKVEQEKKL